MNDGFSAEKNEALKRVIIIFFLIKNLDFPQKWSERRSDNLFIFLKLISRKNGVSEEAIFF